MRALKRGNIETGLKGLVESCQLGVKMTLSAGDCLQRPPGGGARDVFRGQHMTQFV